MFRKLDLFPCSGKKREVPTLLGHLEIAKGPMIEVSFFKRPNRVGISSPSHEDVSRPSFCVF
jgi:hypothetical protein